MNRERVLYSIAGGMANNVLSLGTLLADGHIDDSEIPALLEVQAQECRNLESLEMWLLGFVQAMQLLSYGELSPRMAKRLASRARDVERTYGKAKDRTHLHVVGPDYNPEPPNEAA